MATITGILYPAFAGMAGSISVNAMGFGSAIVYLFVYEIGSMAGLESNGLPGLKYAVFLQTLGLLAILPILVWNSNFRQHLPLDAAVVMAPINLICAPIGVYIQQFVPVPILRIIIGTTTLFLAIWQLIQIYQLSVRAARVNGLVVTGAVIENGNAGVHEDGDRKVSTEKEVNGGLVDDDNDQNRKTEILENKVTIQDESDLTVKNNSAQETAPTSDPPESPPPMEDISFKRKVEDMKAALWPITPRLIFMILASIVGGLLGGLVGAGGPPLFLYFFVYDICKEHVRAIGGVFSVTTTTSRLITYLVTSPEEGTTGSNSWFVARDVWIYVAIATAELLGSPIGMFLNKYLNKWGFKVGLCVLLILNGISMITTGSLALAK